MERCCDCPKMDRRIRLICREVCPTGKQGEQGIQGIQGETGERGEQGIQGIQGIRGEAGQSGVPQVYHFTMSQSALGRKINVGKNIYYTIAKDGDAGLMRVMLQGTMSAIGKTAIDVNWVLQRNGVVSGGSQQNILIDNLYFILTDGIQMESTDLHKTTIRSKNANTGLCELYEITIWPSMSGQKIDIWVNEIYSNFEGVW